MGIVVDLDRSNIVFKEPNALDQRTTIGQNTVDYQLYSFAIQFGIKFDPDPKIGLGGAPTDPELYRIGIVQNVLHERLFFQYEKQDERSKRTVKRVFEKTSDHPAVDIVENTFDRPFYSTPSFDSNKRKTRPVSTIWYTPQGYGELLNPYSKSGVAIDNRPDTLDMWDQPGGGAFFTLPDGAMLMRMEKVLGFQAWLVVKQALKIDPLAHVPAFSLMFLV